MTNTSGADSSASTAFECILLDADEAHLIVKQRVGVIVYVRVLSGSLPSPLTNVLVGSYDSLYGRPAKGAFSPVPALLTVPAGRSYRVTMLASLPPLAAIRPHLRSGLRPPPDLDPAAVPVALEGLPRNFRATAGRLVAVQEHGDDGAVDQDTRTAQVPQAQWDAQMRVLAPRHLGAPRDPGATIQPPLGVPAHALTFRIQITQMEWEAGMRAKTVRRLGAQGNDEAAIEPLLEALADEIEVVRKTAAYALRLFAAKLPLAPFLAAIRDKRQLNFAACHVAAYVFDAHPDEVPIEALLDLYHGMSPDKWSRPPVQVVVVHAMGRLGARAPVEVLELLANILTKQRGSQDIRVQRQAALALGELGERAPVEALVAGMGHLQPEVAAAAAQALLQHPAQISEELRERARIMSDVEMARRLIYGKWSQRQG